MDNIATSNQTQRFSLLSQEFFSLHYSQVNTGVLKSVFNKSMQVGTSQNVRISNLLERIPT